jgi:hypothetical protein
MEEASVEKMPDYAFKQSWLPQRFFTSRRQFFPWHKLWSSQSNEKYVD